MALIGFALFVWCLRTVDVLHDSSGVALIWELVLV